jgi:peroxidase
LSEIIEFNYFLAREHGITGYNDYRESCNLTRASSFEDLRGEIPDNLIKSFKRIYKHVDDIDLFPGGMSERALLGGLVGPTFACIIGRQFNKLKRCDRFWYENSDPLVRFTEPQLQEIRQSTLSKILCDNCDGVTTLQLHVFISFNQITYNLFLIS